MWKKENKSRWKEKKSINESKQVLIIKPAVGHSSVTFPMERNGDIRLSLLRCIISKNSIKFVHNIVKSLCNGFLLLCLRSLVLWSQTNTYYKSKVFHFGELKRERKGRSYFPPGHFLSCTDSLRNATSRLTGHRLERVSWPLLQTDHYYSFVPVWTCNLLRLFSLSSCSFMTRERKEKKERA